jgi:hypothetical protein
VDRLLEAESASPSAGRPDVTAPVAQTLYLVTGPPVRAAPVWCPPAGAARSYLQAVARLTWRGGNQVAVLARSHRGGQGPHGGGLLAPFDYQDVWSIRHGLCADVTAEGRHALLLVRAQRTAPAGRTPGPFTSSQISIGCNAGRAAGVLRKVGGQVLLTRAPPCWPSAPWTGLLCPPPARFGCGPGEEGAPGPPAAVTSRRGSVATSRCNAGSVGGVPR